MIVARKYNPGFLTDDELVASFCVRTNEFDSIIEVLRECTGRSNPHQIVIGPRGSGKTTLLLRVAAEVRRDPQLSSSFFPIVFAEESYEVSTAGEFWLECLSRLAVQAPNREENPDLHRSYEDLRTIQNDRMLAERCLGALLDFSDQENKCLVLLVENLNMMFDDMMDRDAGWRLRKILQTEPRIVLLASATSRFDEIDNPDQALYDLFRVSTLRALGTNECAILWETVSGQCRPPETIRSLEILTGGSPRLLAMVARFGAELSFRELMADLLDLVDDHTEYFKSHLEALPPQERRVYLALADLWKPATTKEIGDRARLETSKCSAQLKRLVERGTVQVAGGTARRKQYYLTERLYNIYYLLRRARGPDSLVDALVNFMESFYSPPEQRDIFARLAFETSNLDAWTETMRQNALARMIQMPALSHHRDEVTAARQLFDRAVALDNQFRKEEALAAYDTVVSQYGAKHTPDIQQVIARSLVNKGAVLHELARPDEALATFDEVLGRYGQRSSPALLDSIAGALVNKGSVLHRLHRLEEALIAYNEVITRFGASHDPALLMSVGRALINKGVTLYDSNQSEEALATYDEVVSRLGKNDSEELLQLVAQSLVNKGATLSGLNRLKHALATYDEVVNRFGWSGDTALLEPVGQALVNKGVALNEANRHEDALASADEVVSRLGESDDYTVLEVVTQALILKATALLKLNRSDQALAAYDEVVTRFGSSETPSLAKMVAQTFFNKGNELKRLKRSEEAVAAYDNVVRQFDEHGSQPYVELVAMALVNKSVALTNLERLDDALATCDEVVRRFGKGDSVMLEPATRALVFKARHLQARNRNEEALSAYDEVLTQYEETKSQELTHWVQITLLEKASLELKIGRHEAATVSIDRLFDFQPDTSPENRSRSHLIRASATLALGDIDACERDVRSSLDLLPEIDGLPETYLDELVSICVDFGLGRMRTLMRASQAAHLLLPVTTALELEIGIEPRVAVEIMEVAQDIRRRYPKLAENKSISSSRDQITGYTTEQ